MMKQIFLCYADKIGEPECWHVHQRIESCWTYEIVFSYEVYGHNEEDEYVQFPPREAVAVSNFGGLWSWEISNCHLTVNELKEMEEWLVKNYKDIRVKE